MLIRCKKGKTTKKKILRIKICEQEIHINHFQFTDTQIKDNGYVLDAFLI